MSEQAQTQNDRRVMLAASVGAQAKESEVKWFHWLAMAPIAGAAIIIFAAMKLLEKWRKA